MVDFGDIWEVLKVLAQAGGTRLTTPLGGQRPSRLPSLTMLRGKIVVENGTFKDELNDGQLLPCKVPEEIRTQPAV